MKKVAIASCAVLALAACETPRKSTADRFQQSETNRAMQVSDNCRVTAARYVELVDDSRAADQRASAGQAAGTIAGGIIGAAIGSNIGSGSGRTVATGLGAVGGALGGAAVASQYDQVQRQDIGVEYTVRVDGREMVVVQNLRENEQALPAGSRCRLVRSGGSVRVQSG